MGFRMYKSVRLGKGVRLNLSKTGVGISTGFRGARYSVHSSGRTTKSVGILGSGLSYRQTSSTGRSRGPATSSSSLPEAVPVYPKVGALASKADKLFVRGVTAYMQGNYGEALTSFKDLQARDAADRHIAEEFFAGLSLVGLGRNAEAVRYLEAVLASDYPIPDPLMAKYGVGGSMEIGVTPAAMAIVPMSNLATALILAEVYQELDQPQRAIELLESLGSHAPDEPVFALSLADLYFEADQWDNVVRVTEGIRENEDDVSLNIIILRASALNELRMHEGALALINEALRSKKRNPRLLLFARYVRGRAYETAGKARMARKEYEKVYAEDSTYQDVSERLGRGTSPSTDAPPRPDV